MSKVPINLSALQELHTAVREAHRLIQEAREAPGDQASIKLAEVEERLNGFWPRFCPFAIIP